MAAVIKRSFESQATDVLRDFILSGSLETGQRLTEIALSKQLEVSRGTIRTALHHLTNEGLVSLKPYAGWQVVSLSEQDMWEVFTLRSSLESLAARLVAEKVKDKAVSSKVKAAFELFESACKTKKSTNQIAEADFALHRTLVNLTNHKRLQNHYRLVEQLVRLCILTEDKLVANAETLLKQHRPLVKAILAGDAVKAETLARAHILSSSYLKKLKENRHAT
jgi:DNA-binding GntR family transcriptional regulator